MKILHTSDWHIGKLVHGQHFTNDQKYLLDKLVELIKKEKPDVMVIAGDVYDRSVPPIEAVELLDNTLSDILLTCNTKIIIIAGNHDSPDRLSFANKILMEKGLTIAGKLSNKIEPIIINDDYGEVHFYAIPYSDYPVVRKLFSDDNIKNHNQAMGKIIGLIKENMNLKVRNVCIAHGYVMGKQSLVTSESERPLAIGGSEFIDAELFSDFDYVALGHLHQPQKVVKDNIRYAGSLMKYSFSEANQKKSITTVELLKKGQVDINLVSINPLRDMRIIRGKLNDLVHKQVVKLGNNNDYLKAELTDEGELIDAIGKLRSVYPNILKIERVLPKGDSGENSTSASKGFLKKNSLDLFNEFYENITSNEFNEDKKQIVAKVIEELNQDDRRK